jgi:hypothetical protein
MALEWWIVGATVIGPVIAIQTQKFIERATENHRRKMMIFSALMANRATKLAPDYVRALNLIDIEFLPRGWSREKNRAVINSWRALFGELGQGLSQGETDKTKIAAWNQRCDDRLVELLLSMSTALGYGFSAEELRRGIYYPQGNVEREEAQLGILHGLRAIMEGRVSLPMKLTEAPGSADAANLQKQLAERMVNAYDTFCPTFNSHCRRPRYPRENGQFSPGQYDRLVQAPI